MLCTVQIPCYIVFTPRPVQSRDISIPSRGVPCFFRPAKSRPVKSHDISIPSRGVPRFFRLVKSRGISIPSRAIPFNLVLYRPVLSIPLLIQSRGIPGYLDPAGSRPETKIHSRRKPWTYGGNSSPIRMTVKARIFLCGIALCLIPN